MKPVRVKQTFAEWIIELLAWYENCEDDLERDRR